MAEQKAGFNIHVPFVDHLGMRITERKDGIVKLRLDPRPELENSWGSMHGGVLMTLLVAATSLTLYPLTYEDLVLEVAPPGSGDVYAVVDDGSPPHPWHECRTDNNRSEDVEAECIAP